MLMNVHVFGEELPEGGADDLHHNGVITAQMALPVIKTSEVLMEAMNEISSFSFTPPELNDGSMTLTLSQRLPDGREIGVILRNISGIPGRWESIRSDSDDLTETLIHGHELHPGVVVS